MQILNTKDVRSYSEVIYFGMNLRQLIFAGLAIAAAVISFFLLKDKASAETVSWVCIVAAAPFGAFGFVRWHGMNMEELIPMWYRSWFCHNQTLYFRPENQYKELLKQYKEESRKETDNAENGKARKKKAQGQRVF